MRDVLWIVDGYNLIRRDPRLSRLERRTGTDAARAFLEGQLGLFRARKGRGHSVVVAYDGVEPSEGRSGRKGLRVLHASDGDADALILREARRAENLAEVNVVTNDVKDIVRRLRGLRINCVSVEEFGIDLWKGARKEESEDEAEKPKAPKGDEVDFWLREFGEEES